MRALWPAIGGFVVVLVIERGNVYIWPSHRVPPEIRDAIRDVVIALIKAFIAAIIIYVVARMAIGE